MISFQGRLTNGAGVSVGAGAFAATFKLYASAAAPTALWTEATTVNTDASGLYGWLLGSTTPFPATLPYDAPYWLGVTIGVGAEMTPRYQLGASPYAMFADTAQYARSASGAWTWIVSDVADSNLQTKRPMGVSRAGATMYGNGDSTHINLGVASITGTSGQDYKYATVGGGYSNTASGISATVGGGSSNLAGDDYAAVGGGYSNTAGGYVATVGGGSTNDASGHVATIGGGWLNTASASYATIGGGQYDTASGEYATIGGGWGNLASSFYATVGGGYYNVASLNQATVGGGYLDSASGMSATVGGGDHNTASGNSATVSGGDHDTASGSGTTVGGGVGNAASLGYTTIGGGLTNRATADYATVGGGLQNGASGSWSTVSGGEGNEAIGNNATVGGGDHDTASGRGATVGGGWGNTASGNLSWAGGHGAQAIHRSAFVWADSVIGSLSTQTFASTAANQFSVRASGGYRLYSNGPLTQGVTMAAGASGWTNVSDSTRKSHIRLVDGDDVLARILQLPIKRWRYIAQDQLGLSVEHIGPMAQDFWREFHVGDDSLGISTIDPDGVSLAGIQALARQNQALSKRIDALEEQNRVLLQRLQTTLPTK